LSAYTTFPIGCPIQYAAYYGVYAESQSVFVSMLGQLDQQPLFNLVNFSIEIQMAENQTAYKIGVSTLWCPSDPTIDRVVDVGPFAGVAHWYTRFSSYGGCSGTFWPEI
jgi:hypothetical protein